MFRKAGDVVFTDVNRDSGEGVVEFSTREDMENAVRKMDDSEFRVRVGCVVCMRLVCTRAGHVADPLPCAPCSPWSRLVDVKSYRWIQNRFDDRAIMRVRLRDGAADGGSGSCSGAGGDRDREDRDRDDDRRRDDGTYHYHGVHCNCSSCPSSHLCHLCFLCWRACFVDDDERRDREREDKRDRRGDAEDKEDN